MTHLTSRVLKTAQLRRSPHSVNSAPRFPSSYCPCVLAFKTIYLIFMRWCCIQFNLQTCRLYETVLTKICTGLAVQIVHCDISDLYLLYWLDELCTPSCAFSRTPQVDLVLRTHKQHVHLFQNLNFVYQRLRVFARRRQILPVGYVFVNWAQFSTADHGEHAFHNCSGTP